MPQHAYARAVDPLVEGVAGLEFGDLDLGAFLEWVVVFDIAGFLCQEIDHWAGRMLRTVSKLAAAFGWSEREILRISPLRRQLYLGMLG